MINIISRSLGMVMIFFFSLSLYASEKWIMDNEHSYVLWRIKHLDFSTQVGKWYVKGFLLFDEKEPQKSKVDVSIDLAQMITGIEALNNHLKGKLFFDVAQYPVATFVSNQVIITGKNEAKVKGMLTVHGVTQPITLSITLNKIGKNPINDKMTIGFSGITKLKRSDFGIKTLLPDLGDDVTLEINAEAYQPGQKDTSHVPQK